MNLTISGHHLEVTPALREYVLNGWATLALVVFGVVGRPTAPPARGRAPVTCRATRRLCVLVRRPAQRAAAGALAPARLHLAAVRRRRGAAA